MSQRSPEQAGTPDRNTDKYVQSKCLMVLGRARTETSKVVYIHDKPSPAGTPDFGRISAWMKAKIPHGFRKSEEKKHNLM